MPDVRAFVFLGFVDNVADEEAPPDPSGYPEQLAAAVIRLKRKPL
jgi:hypothetical protein